MERKTLGVMIDCSRNAVMNVPSLKRFIDYLSKMGYNMLQLYTEDTYEIEGEPYFGYLRGRYTKEELNEIDAYAKERGIEMIPCIQTLAHLNCITRWGGVYGGYTDIGDILLAEDERTYALIDKMFAACRAGFSTNRIHIGMDEAHMVGLGKYLDKHGLQDRSKILIRHLSRVCEIAKKYNFEPMMWSDMFFRLASNGGYFEKDIQIPQEIMDLVPREVGLVYWDYYSWDKNRYVQKMAAHQKFNNPVWFAGGIWSWRGFAPRNSFSLRACEAAVTACNERGIENVFFTMWGDNGGECSYFTALAPLCYAAEISKGNYDMESIKAKFETITGQKWEHMMDLELSNSAAGADDARNTGKFTFYSDPFMGLMDSSIHEEDAAFYAQAAEKLHSYVAEGGEFAPNYYMQACLCDVLAQKALLGIRTRTLYAAGDKAGLAAIAEEYTEVKEKMERFYRAYQQVWMRDNKPFGFEIQEVRLGGTLFRLDSCRERLLQYVKGDLSTIPELDEVRLPFNGQAWGQRLEIQEFSYSTIVTGRI